MKKIGMSVAGAAGSIAVLTLISRLIGFVRTWAQNGALGDTLAGEAYSTSNTVPNVLFEVTAGGALAGAVIPLISGFLANKMCEELDRTASALITWILAVGVPIAAGVAVLAPWVTSALLGEGTPVQEVALATSLLRMFALQIPLYGLSVVLTGILQAHKRFLLPALAPMLSSLTVIAVFAAFSALAEGNQNAPGQLSGAAVCLLGWGTTLGVIAFSLPQLIPVMRLVRIRPTLRFPDGVARRALHLMGAGFGGLVAQQIQIVFIMYVANTRGGTGAYPVYTYANAVYMVPYAVLAVPIATAVFPRLSEAAALPGRPGLVELTARSTRLVVDIGVVCSVLLFVLARPAKLVFDALRPVADMDVAMMAMAPGLVGYALIYHGSRVLYAIESSRAVAAVNAAAWLSVCAVLAIFVASGTRGRSDTFVAIGVAMSIGMSIAAVGQLLTLRRSIGREATAGMARSALLVGGCAGLGGAAAWFLIDAVVSVLGAGLIGALVGAVGGGLVIVACAGAGVKFFDPLALKLVAK